jgi:hypothetical protein
MHTGKVQLPADRHVAVLRDMIGRFQNLFDMGFMPISYESNGCVGKAYDLEKRFYNYFDVVFYKPNMSNDL